MPRTTRTTRNTRNTATRTNTRTNTRNTATSSKPGTKRPNILFIQTDQHSRQVLGCYGNSIVKTPNIDRLAASGVRFDNAFTCTGVCTPSRGALLSGVYPHRSGMIFNPELPGSRMGARLCQYDQSVEPFSRILQGQGYELHNIGKWHIGSWFESKPSQYGFKGQFYPGYGYPREHSHYLKYLSKLGLDGFKLKARKPQRDDGWAYFSEQVGASPEASIPGYLASQAVNVLKKHAKANAAAGSRSVKGRTNKNPWFLALNFWGPHIPINIPAEYLDMYDPADMPLPENLWNRTDNRPAIIDKTHRTWGGHTLTEDTVRRITAAYYGYVTLIDEQIGRVLQTLEDSGMADDTVIVFTTDHGSTLGAHGLQDKGLMMYDEVYHIPLIIAGAGEAASSRKKSAYKNFTVTMDLSATFVDLAGATVPQQYDGMSLKPVIEGDLKMKTRSEVVCEAFGHQVPFVQRFVRDNRYKYIFNTTCVDEFYDIKADPREKNNLIDTADSRLLKKYRRKLKEWGERTDDHPTTKFMPGATRSSAHCVGAD